jgi:hypothetical protein
VFDTLVILIKYTLWASVPIVFDQIIFGEGYSSLKIPHDFFFISSRISFSKKKYPLAYPDGLRPRISLMMSNFVGRAPTP